MTNKPGRIIFYRYRFLLLALLVFGILFAWMNSSLLTTNVYYQQKHEPTAAQIAHDKNQHDLRVTLSLDHQSINDYVNRRDAVFTRTSEQKFEVTKGTQGEQLTPDSGLVAIVSLMIGVIFALFGRRNHFNEWMRGSGIKNRKVNTTQLMTWLLAFNLVVLLNQVVWFTTLFTQVASQNIHLTFISGLAVLVLNQVVTNVWLLMGIVLGTIINSALAALFYGFFVSFMLTTCHVTLANHRDLSLDWLYNPGAYTVGVIILALVLIAGLSLWYVRLAGRLSYEGRTTLLAFPRWNLVFAVLLLVGTFAVMTSFRYYSWEPFAIVIGLAGVMGWQIYGERWRGSVTE
ncbi:hypothetical protein [Lacticaseibacillus saniviri]|uniref:hypothetical protein n=1 Tax=Lacticaseibacillus saniviri TaxID=931533 RepID=UPI0007052502|nr:hypothetical protein [Lacticaseibacillus saniviri]MCG4281865.1 hypothetical protein [Lacticaseibacillus saniviri]